MLFSVKYHLLAFCLPEVMLLSCRFEDTDVMEILQKEASPGTAKMKYNTHNVS